MQFTLRTLLIYFVFVAAALGAFGGWGILVVAVCTAYGLCARSMGFIAATILLTLGTLVAAAYFLPATCAVREAPPRATCANNLKQIGLALHAYYDRYGSFPPAYVADANGKPMHSWRVLILPFLEHHPLYRAYDFDEPWDGPNNSQLQAQKIREYRCPEDPSAAAGTTSYVAVVGGPPPGAPGPRGGGG